jgi:hypothetical protein
MKNMSPTEYEVLFALFKLKQNGVSAAAFNHICGEVNRMRKQNKQKQLSFQLVYYYLSRLAKQPFIKKENDQKVVTYKLENGLWKLNQSPPLCLFISDDVQTLLPCPEVANCRKRKPDEACPPIKAMKEMVEIPMATMH